MTLSPMSGIHVGIIMDGNGRWAAARGLPRSAGHHAGVRTARSIVEAAVRAGIGTLTLYAFSSDNWSRPTPEVTGLLRLLRRSLHTESKRCLENGVRLTIVGRRDRLPAALRAAHRRRTPCRKGYSSIISRCRAAIDRDLLNDHFFMPLARNRNIEKVDDVRT